MKIRMTFISRCYDCYGNSMMTWQVENSGCLRINGRQKMVTPGSTVTIPASWLGPQWEVAP